PIPGNSAVQNSRNFLALTQWPHSDRSSALGRQHRLNKLPACAAWGKFVPRCGLWWDDGEGSASVHVSLFITCYNDTLFPATGQSVVRLLERLGHMIDFPLEQTCCGQMHYNTGYQPEAMPLMRRFVEIFRDAEVVCIPSSSCVAM